MSPVVLTAEDIQACLDQIVAALDAGRPAEAAGMARSLAAVLAEIHPEEHGLDVTHARQAALIWYAQACLTLDRLDDVSAAIVELRSAPPASDTIALWTALLWHLHEREFVSPSAYRSEGLLCVWVLLRSSSWPDAQYLQTATHAFHQLVADPAIPLDQLEAFAHEELETRLSPLDAADVHQALAARHLASAQPQRATRQATALHRLSARGGADERGLLELMALRIEAHVARFDSKAGPRRLALLRRAWDAGAWSGAAPRIAVELGLELLEAVRAHPHGELATGWREVADVVGARLDPASSPTFADDSARLATLTHQLAGGAPPWLARDAPAVRRVQDLLSWMNADPPARWIDETVHDLIAEQYMDAPARELSLMALVQGMNRRRGGDHGAAVERSLRTALLYADHPEIWITAASELLAMTDQHELLVDAFSLLVEYRATGREAAARRNILRRHHAMLVQALRACLAALEAGDPRARSALVDVLELARCHASDELLVGVDALGQPGWPEPVEQYRGELPPDVALLYLLRVDDAFITATVSRPTPADPSGIHAERYEITAERQAELVFNFQQALGQREWRMAAADASALGTALGLGSAVRPLLERSVRHICIIRDEALDDVPCGALAIDGRPLLELVSLSYHPNGRDALRGLQLPADVLATRRVAFIPELRANGRAVFRDSDRRAHWIETFRHEHRALAERGFDIVGGDGLAPPVLNVGHYGARVLHLSGHAQRREARSIIRMEGSPLTAEAVEALELGGVELVVLNVCWGGLDELTGGDRWDGLAAAFRRGGVPTVVTSRSSARAGVHVRFDELFYDNSSQGQGVARATRAAQLALWHGSEPPLLLDWATYEVHGAPHRMLHHQLHQPSPRLVVP